MSVIRTEMIYSGPSRQPRHPPRLKGHIPRCGKVAHGSVWDDVVVAGRPQTDRSIQWRTLPQGAALKVARGLGELVNKLSQRPSRRRPSRGV